MALYREKRAMFFNATDLTSKLVYLEECSSRDDAIAKFNEMRVYTRSQKERLIRNSNPNWIDLSAGLASSIIYHPGAKFKPNTPNLTSLR